jgi:hypothetical protein
MCIASAICPSCHPSKLFNSVAESVARSELIISRKSEAILKVLLRNATIDLPDACRVCGICSLGYFLIKPSDIV